ncbi:MAG TPA: aspartyl protease family protein [Bryobacteraceae bacterium]|nr:aspartyl protease family protein [Bryobacteraceae bacterium]
MKIRRVTGCVAVAGFLLSAAEPDDTLAIGRKALQNEGVATAWRLAQKATSEAPASAAAHEFSGEVLFRRGDFDQAETEFKRATQLDPNYALAWWGLARVNECSSMAKTAVENYRRAYTLAPKDPRILRSWATHIAGQEQAEALANYASMAGRNASDVDREDLEQRLQFARAARGRSFTVLASAYKHTDIPLAPLVNEKNNLRTYGLAVNVNGTLLNLVLDTGANGIVIARKTAERAGVARISDAVMRGFGDSARPSAGYRGVAGHVRIGDIEYRDPLISVADQDTVGLADGLIGTNMFSEFLITLDFSAKILRLDPLPGYHPGDAVTQDRSVPPGLEHAARVYRFGHLLLLPTRVNGSREGLFVIDTGADRSLISYDLAAEVTKLSQDSRMHFSGINGRVIDLYRTGDLVLQFAGFEQKSPGMSSIDTFDQSRRVGTEISGFLGLPVLDLFALTIDYRDGLVNFARK